MKLPDFCAEFSCSHSCLSDGEVITAQQQWAQAAGSDSGPCFHNPCKPKSGFHPLANATEKLEVFGTCSHMERYLLLACSAIPWPRNALYTHCKYHYWLQRCSWFQSGATGLEEGKKQDCAICTHREVNHPKKKKPKDQAEVRGFF